MGQISSLMSIPLISVIIPVYNSALFLPELLNNIYKQHYTPLEIIIVDDGSTDSTAILIKSFPDIKYIYQTNKGPAAARNEGLAVATGEYIAFIDSDDLWNENTLLTFSKILVNNNDIDIVEGLIKEIPFKKSSYSKIKHLNPFYHCSFGSCLIRKSAFDKVGNCNERLIYTEDVDWFTRAWEMNIVKKRIDFVSIFYRKHQHNMTNNSANCLHYKLLLLQIKIARQKNNSHLPLPKGNLNDFLGQSPNIK